ncbi:MAG TPA: hypothetical protein VEU11_05925 [Terriglobales bacterium]|nr:hypothetical protein [Terriglobales bacterium]
MGIPQLLSDVIRLLLLLAPSAAVLCLILAGISLRREGGPAAVVGGSFGKWMFWAIVFITLPGLMSWFPSFGVPAPLPGGGVGTGWMANLQNDLANFVSNFVVKRLATSLAAFFVLRAILDTIQGGHPLPSILAAMFLLAVQTTINLIQSYNSGTQFATADVLDSLWNYLAGTICPIAAGLAIVGAIWQFVTRRPVMPMVGATLGLLTVSAVWRLVVTMM